jgi:hypothetical protein
MLTNMTSMICYQNNIVLHQFFNLLLMDVNTKTCSAISIYILLMAPMSVS